MLNWLIIICLFLFLSLLIALISKIKLNEKERQIQAMRLKIENQNMTIEVSKALEEKTLQNAENERLRMQESHQAQLKELKASYEENLKLLETRLKENYTSQNTLLFAQNKQTLQEDSKKILDEIFKPIKEQIKSYDEGLKRSEAVIQTQIKNLFEHSQSVGAQADKLAKVLKGDKKWRGNFGELQLKFVLQQSGLIEGEQYRLQESIRAEGARYIPDAIIYLEKNKNVIVDSKFSLPNSFDFDNITEQTCQEVLKNLKDRIDELAKKPYESLKENSYEFVLLFLPYQNLLDLALSVDATIYQYAYEKKIYLTTPHTLFMALKTISITWLNIKRNDNVQQAFSEISKFYDKFLGVVETFEDMKKALIKVNALKDQMDNRLVSGSGNLASRFEKLKELGVESKKALEK